MASTADRATEAAPEVEVPAPQVLPVSESKTSVRSFYRLESGSLVPCEPNAAQIINYTSPTIAAEADHAATIFKRPKSFCAGDNFLMKPTSTGIFVYEDYLVIVMADDSPIFEGR